MSASVIWNSTGPPDSGIGVAPQAGKTGGARGKNHQADSQGGKGIISQLCVQRQRESILPALRLASIGGRGGG